MSSCGKRSVARLALSLAKGRYLSGSSVAAPSGVLTCNPFFTRPQNGGGLLVNRYRLFSTHTQATNQLLDVSRVGGLISLHESLKHGLSLVSVLQSLCAAKLRDQINSLAFEKPYMTYPQFLELVKEQ
jgi:hypothetical protein